MVIQSLSKPSNIPDLVNAGLWYQKSTNTIYGGFAGRRSYITGTNQPNQYPLGVFSFKPDGDGLGTFDVVVKSQAWGSNTRPMQGAIAFGDDTGYVLGGCASSDTSPETADYSSPVALDGLLTFDMGSQTLNNISATGYNGNGTVEYAKMEYVAPFGPQGLFVILGGDQPPNVDGEVGEDSFIPFTTVSVYEPASNKWYQQSTTGNIPEPRKEFCTAGVASTNETYEIFLYAGWGGNLGSAATPYDEIFILTLPAFTWVKVDYPPKSPRHALSCNAVGGSQIITIGGLDSASADAFSANVYQDVFNTSDPFANGLNIFDMSTLSFADKYTANPPPYTQSALIASVYDSNPNTQYDDPALGSLMSQKNFNSQTTGISGGSASGDNSTNSNPGPGLTPTSSGSGAGSDSNSSSSSSNTGAIAGGVVGGVVGLALLAAAVFYFLRRGGGRQNQHNGGAYTPADNHSPGLPPTTTMQERDAGPLPAGAGFYAPPSHDQKTGAATAVPATVPAAPPPQELHGTDRQEMEGDMTAQEVHGDVHPFELAATSPTVSSVRNSSNAGAFVPSGRKQDVVRSPAERHPARTQDVVQNSAVMMGPPSDSEELYAVTPTNLSSAGGSDFGSSPEETGTVTSSLADTLRLPESLRSGSGR